MAIKKLVNFILKMIFGVEEIKNRELGIPRSILLVRQHNQMGDLIVSTPILRAIKETFPTVYLTVIVGPQNYKGYQNNPYIDELFIFDKRQLFQRNYFTKLKTILRKKYDVAIVPAVTSISFTSNFLGRLSNSKRRIGVSSLDGKRNSSYYFFDTLVELDWREAEETHVASRNLAIVKPINITTTNLKLIINSNSDDILIAKEFINKILVMNNKPIIGIHAGAGKIQNRWNYNNFVELIKKLQKDFNANIYLSEGGQDDKKLNDEIKKLLNENLPVFKKPGMGILKEVIEHSDLFITNDTGPMHTAASTETPVISLFGPTSPHMWSPIGTKKTFLWKDEDINKISVDDVYQAASNFIK